MPRPCTTHSRLLQRSDHLAYQRFRHPAPRARGGLLLFVSLESMMTRSKRIYVLDTNVLMHDPTALFKFEEHDVYLPMQVIEELDNGKKGNTEASRNARQ